MAGVSMKPSETRLWDPPAHGGMPLGRGQSNLEPSSPRKTCPKTLTILGGVSTRMTNRTSQEFSPQFCGRTRRLMHTCRFSKALEVQLAGTGQGTQHTAVTLGSWSSPNPKPPSVPPGDPC